MDVATKLSTTFSTMRRGKEEHAVDAAGKALGPGYRFTNMSVMLVTTVHRVSNSEDPYNQHHYIGSAFWGGEYHVCCVNLVMA